MNNGIKIWALLAMGLAGCCFAQEEGVRRRLKEMKGDNEELAQVAEMELLGMEGRAIETLSAILDAGEKDEDYAEAKRIYPAVLEKAGRLTLVTVHTNKQDVKEALKQFDAANGRWKFTINGGWNNYPSSATVDFDRIPYNLAAMELCRKVGGATDDGFAGLRMWETADRRPVWAEWGNVVILDSIQYVRSADYGHGTRVGPKTTAILKVMLDPGLRGIYGGIFKDLEGTDEKGAKLSFGKKAMESDGPMPKIIKQHELVIESPDEGMKKIARLRGKVYEQVGTDFESWTIEDFSKATGMSKQIGGVKMTVKEAVMLDANQARLVLSLTIPTPAGPEIGEEIKSRIPFALMSGAFSAESEGVPEGWRLNAQGCQTNVQAGDERKADYLCIMSNDSKQPTKDVKFKVTIPTKMSGIWVGFDFKDIEMP